MSNDQQIIETERNNYSQALETQSKLKAVIIGQDPYPNDPMGIAFCKHSFDDLFHDSCCGQHLLLSLGLTKKSILKHSDLFKKPEAVFYYLLTHGIAILNISYKRIDIPPFVYNQTSRDFNAKLFSNNEEKIVEAKIINQPFLEKSKMVFVLGKSKTYPIFSEYYKEFEATETLLHPSNYNAKKTVEWQKIWGTPYLINKIKQGNP